MFKNFSLNRMLVLFVAVGFAFLTVDAIIEHWAIFQKEIMAFIPVVFGALGFVVSTIVMIQWNERWIRFLHLALFAVFVIAGAGVYFHLGEDEEEKARMTAEQREEEKQEKEKPLLAPLSFAGLAVVGLLGTSRKWHAEVV